jgi:hypothetical protein
MLRAVMKPRSVFRRSVRQWLAGALLLSLALQSLVPVGFMPSAGRPFTLEICPSSFPVELFRQRQEPQHGSAHHSHHDGHAQHHGPAHHDGHAPHHGFAHHDGHALHHGAASHDSAAQDSEGGSHSGRSTAMEHCLFGLASVMGVLPQATLVAVVSEAPPAPILLRQAPLPKTRLILTQQPRAPPGAPETQNI